MQDIFPDMYEMFTFELLHNLHLGLSNLLKEVVVAYMSFETILTNRVHAQSANTVSTGEDIST